MATQRSATGYSEQAAVMTELLFRGANVAIPFIDDGTDLVTFDDARERIAWLQVKSSQGTPYKKGEGYRAQFNIPRKQLRDEAPLLFFALVVRLEGYWVSYSICPQSDLLRLWRENPPFGIENESSDELALKFQYRPDAIDSERMTVRCGAADLAKFLDAWHLLPPLHPATSQPTAQ